MCVYVYIYPIAAEANRQERRNNAHGAQAKKEVDPVFLLVDGAGLVCLMGGCVFPCGFSSPSPYSIRGLSRASFLCARVCVPVVNCQLHIRGKREMK